IAALGVETVWLGEGAASASIISPMSYAEFVKPYAKIVTDAVAAKGITCFMHVCGDINPSLKEIIATGVPALDVDHLVSMQSVRDVAGAYLCIKGNLNPVELLTATTAKAEILCEAALRSTTAPLILGTGCLVARDTPKENIDAMVTASKKIASE
ncbi:MAG: uroporphyrinogen decarboxylase family protein, partial [Ruthenibacterium sp.]